MNKFHFKFIYILISIFGLSACMDLDVPSDGRSNYSDIFAEYQLAKNFYYQCQNSQPQFGMMYNQTLLASFSDEAHDASDGVNGAVNDWYNNRTSSSLNPVNGPYAWNHYFTAIRKCNIFLKNISDPTVATFDFDPVEKQGWIGQTLVFRSFYYLQLIKRYGGVPIISEPYDVLHDFSKDKRATFEECVDFIISGCDEALALPESNSLNTGFRWNIGDDQRGTPTRALAYAIKSQAALYAASPLFYTPDSKYNWKYVAEITKEALDQCLAHGFKLFDVKPAADIAQNAYAYYFINRSDPSRLIDKETIFETRDVRMEIWKWAGTPIVKGVMQAGSCPSQELVDSYEMQDTGELPVVGYSDANHLKPIINEESGYDPKHPYEGRDPRFYASIYYNNSPRYLTPNSVLVETFVDGNCGINDEPSELRYTRTGYYLRKFNHNKSKIEFAGDGYMKIFRLAELYLNFAEAVYNAYGPDHKIAFKASGVGTISARDAVNIVRSRVEMPDIPSGLSKEDFEKRYRNERRVELAFEEHRFFDVRRWKILKDTDDFVTGVKIKKSGDSFTYDRFKLQSRGTNADKYLLFPLDLSEVTKMQKFTGQNWQNPGW